jgi:hypothetical protein
MTEEEIKIFQINKVIAKFMGWKVEIILKYNVARYNLLEWVDDKGETVYAGRDDRSLTDEDGFDYSIPFNLDYNWLMSVVDKIESMGYKFKICRKRCQICKDEAEEVFFVDIKLDSKRNAVYQAVYKFIKSNKQ